MRALYARVLCGKEAQMIVVHSSYPYVDEAERCDYSLAVVYEVWQQGADHA